MPQTAKTESRSSGLLLHVTSLPGGFGIGDLGPEARSFIARTAEAGQRYWQVLPVGPTGYGNSPYSALSSFAGNPLLISPDLLAEVGLLDREEIDGLRSNGARVDFGAVYPAKERLLSRTISRWRAGAGSAQRESYEGFVEREGPRWLDEFCLYLAAKEAHEGRPWTSWAPELARRDRGAMADARAKLKDSIDSHRVAQFLFFEQWNSLRSAARAHGVELVGDLPLYVAHDSADVWANRELFLLDQHGEAEVVAGVPPDYFSETGQRWGNPVFDWERMTARGFSWWRSRVRHALDMFDVLRIDHFRGLAAYWEIPASEETAVNGRWRPAPGEKLLSTIRDDLGALPLVAEDLGVITDDVIQLRDRFGLPGMRVAQFGFDEAPDTKLHHPDNYPENVWAYTGTHDNNTTAGWFWEGNPQHRIWRLNRSRRMLYRTVDGRIPWGLVELVSRSRARTSVFPVQDILGLGGEARMNTPGTTSGNWEWRLRPGELSDEAMTRLLELTRASGRVVG